MSRDSKLYTLLNAAPVRGIASSTNASPIVITTSAAHGLSSGDLVTIFGHLVNTNANGSHEIVVTGASSFELVDSSGNGVGIATGVFAPQANIVDVTDFPVAMLAFDTDGGGDAILKVQVVGSIQENAPDFAAPQGPDNQYAYLDMIDTNLGTEVVGDDGFVVATADSNKMYEVNINGMKHLSVIPTEGSIGEVTVKLRTFNER